MPISRLCESVFGVENIRVTDECYCEILSPAAFMMPDFTMYRNYETEQNCVKYNKYIENG